MKKQTPSSGDHVSTPIHDARAPETPQQLEAELSERITQLQQLQQQLNILPLDQRGHLFDHIFRLLLDCNAITLELSACRRRAAAEAWEVPQ